MCSQYKLREVIPLKLLLWDEGCQAEKSSVVVVGYENFGVCYEVKYDEIGEDRLCLRKWCL